MRNATLLVCLVTSGLACRAQGAATEGGHLAPAEYFRLRKEAAALMRGNGVAKACALYQSLAADASIDGGLWEKLGACNSRRGNFAAAAEAYQKAFPLAASSKASIAYQIAQSTASAAQPEQALTWLQRALSEGYERRMEIASDPAFASLRSNRVFQQICGVPQKPADRTEAWRSDLDYLKAEIIRLHFRYRKEALPPEFAGALDLLKVRVPQLTDSEIVTQIQKLMAQLGDGHSMAYFFFGRNALPQLPIQLYLFADGIYVVHAEGDLRPLIGARVAQIGNTDAIAALHRIEPFVSRDNPGFVHAMGVAVYLRTPDFLKAAGIIDDPRQVPLTVIREGKESQVTLTPVAPGNIVKSLTPSELAGAGAVPLYLAREAEPYWFEYLPESQAVYFQFNRVDNDPREPVPQFAQRLDAYLDAHKDAHLIVDLRHNFGGDAGMLPPLLRTLAHFQASHPRAGLYVLTSRSTYSAAVIFAAQVEGLTNAVFAGEAPSSPANFVGEDIPVQLPNSGLTLSISTRFHQGNPADPWLWIAPEIPVALSADDYFANRDPVLKAVLDVIGTGR